jgi:hypothetical protein
MLFVAVWGGDPVYPTINYEQDPDCVADYRNANMHEPTPDIIDQLREVGNHYPSFHVTHVSINKSFDYTKCDIYCDLLFGITQCYNCLLCISFFTNHGRIGCLDTIEHQHLYLAKRYINSKKIQEHVTPNSKSH